MPFVILFIGKEAYKARARSWRGHLYSGSPTACLQCASSWPSDRVCHCSDIELVIASPNGITSLTCMKVRVTNFYLCSKPCKVGVKYLEDGTKVRVSRGIGTSGSIVPRPEILKIRTTPRPAVRKYLTSLIMLFHVWVVDKTWPEPIENREKVRRKMNLNYEKGVWNKQANNVAYIIYNI